jgi:DNA/RNA-binding domain of Phe-tRNA-synthetase-like protein
VIRIVGDRLAAIVRPGSMEADRLRVVDADARLNDALARAAETARRAEDAAAVTTAVRAMYKQIGIDPTKTRPSSEALLRRVRKGGELPRINNLVDVINWCSLESQLPFGLYDLDAVRGEVVIRLGTEGEEYAGIRKDTVHVANRLVLADDLGAFGNPTSDSARTSVTSATTRALIVIFAPPSVPSTTVDQVLRTTAERIASYCLVDVAPE